jgi:acyl-CoA thioesterase I
MCGKILTKRLHAKIGMINKATTFLYKTMTKHTGVMFLAIVVVSFAIYLSTRRVGSDVCNGIPLDGDTLFFIKEIGQQHASASLLCVPRTIPNLRSATREIQYRAGRDFTWAPSSRRIELTANSTIPFKTRPEMYPMWDGHNVFVGSSKYPGKAVLFAEGRFFHDLQIVAKYQTDEHWADYAHKSAPELLPRTFALLRDNKPIHLVVLGDSISMGANASGFVGAKPNLPAYPDLVARGLEARGASKVTLTNLSVGGTTSSWGITRIREAVALKPDLLVIAFGMNDAGGAPPVTSEQYGVNIGEMIQSTIGALPGCEIILVAPMIGNPEWDYLDQTRLPAFRNELLHLEHPGVAVADVTSFWAALLTRKGWYDLTGNGLNHPNDFGHIVYSAVILDLLTP